jgi:hypothetical protein
MSSITMRITINDVDGERCGVTVSTESFTPSDTPDHVGECWVGICTAINLYMRENGSPLFNCLKPEVRQ